MTKLGIRGRPWKSSVPMMQISSAAPQRRRREVVSDGRRITFMVPEVITVWWDERTRDGFDC